MGFHVEGMDRRPVFVCLSPDRTHFLICDEQEDANVSQENPLLCSLYGYYHLIDTIAGIAMQDWKRPAESPSPWGGIQQWAISRTKRALHFRGVYQQWQRLLALVPEPQRSVTKAVFSATFDSTQLPVLC